MSACRYVEVHMEQGPILEAGGEPLGVVAGIAGQTRLFVMLHGTQVSLTAAKVHDISCTTLLAYSNGPQ